MPAIAPDVVALLITFLIGLLVASGELVSRYRDDPAGAVFSSPGLGYLFFNGVVAAGTYYLIDRVYMLELGADHATNGVSDTAKKVLAAGFGSMAALRSAVVSIRAGDTVVPVGPAALVKIFTDALDRSVDRGRAAPRAKEIEPIMADVSFVRASAALPGMCLALMQNVTEADRTALQKDVSHLAQEPNRTDRDKAVALGLLLAGVVGFEVLRRAKALCGDAILAGRKDRAAVVAGLMSGLDEKVAFDELPPLCLLMHGSVAEEDQAALSSDVEGLREQKWRWSTKALTLGLILASVVGEDYLCEAVRALRREADGDGDGGEDAATADGGGSSAPPTPNPPTPSPPAAAPPSAGSPTPSGPPDPGA